MNIIENPLLIGNNYLVRQNAGFYITRNNDNEEVYQWIERSLSDYSSVKLLKMLQIIEEQGSSSNTHIASRIKDELASRSNNTFWNLPH